MLTFTIINANTSELTVAVTDTNLTVTLNVAAVFPLDRPSIRKQLRDSLNTQIYMNNLLASMQALIGTPL